MEARDIVVIGASAGGLQPLRELVAGLPPKLPAAVFIVVHLSPPSPGVLPRILGRDSTVPIEIAVDGEKIETGRKASARPAGDRPQHPRSRRLRSDPRHPEDRERCLRSGVQAHLSKPVSFADLAQARAPRPAHPAARRRARESSGDRAKETVARGSGRS